MLPSLWMTVLSSIDGIEDTEIKVVVGSTVPFCEFLLSTDLYTEQGNSLDISHFHSIKIILIFLIHQNRLSLSGSIFHLAGDKFEVVTAKYRPMKVDHCVQMAIHVVEFFHLYPMEHIAVAIR